MRIFFRSFVDTILRQKIDKIEVCYDSEKLGNVLETLFRSDCVWPAYNECLGECLNMLASSYTNDESIQILLKVGLYYIK